MSNDAIVLSETRSRSFDENESKLIHAIYGRLRGAAEGAKNSYLNLESSIEILRNLHKPIKTNNLFAIGTEMSSQSEELKLIEDEANRIMDIISTTAVQSSVKLLELAGRIRKLVP